MSDLNCKLNSILFTLNEAYGKLNNYPDFEDELLEHAFNHIRVAMDLVVLYKSLDENERRDS